MAKKKSMFCNLNAILYHVEFIHLFVVIFSCLTLHEFYVFAFLIE
jgi:hypothetical protein